MDLYVLERYVEQVVNNSHNMSSKRVQVTPHLAIVTIDASDYTDAVVLDNVLSDVIWKLTLHIPTRIVLQVYHSINGELGRIDRIITSHIHRLSERTYPVGKPSRRSTRRF